MPALFQPRCLAAFVSIIGLACVVAVPVSQAAFPGANGRLVYTNSAGNMVTVNYDGSNTQPLTSGLDPQWSPDGTKLVFWRNPGGIWIINGDGSGQHQIRATGRSPAWSPDGSKIVFSDAVALPGGSKFRLHVMNSDGTGAAQLPVESEAGSDGSLFRPSWSPDGEHIAYVDHSLLGGGLFVVDADGSDRQVVVPIDPNILGTIATPEWLPDSSRIASSRWMASDGEVHLFTIRPDGSDENDLGRGGGPIAWSPDGTLYGYGPRIWIPETGEFKSPLFAGDINSWQPIPSNAANLAVSKSDSPDPAYLGETIDYTIVVRHVTGSQTATSSVLTDTVPSSLSVESATSTQGTCSIAGQAVTCQLGNIVPAGSVTVTIRARAVQTGNNITNTATVQAATSDPDLINNSDSELTAVPVASGYPRPKSAGVLAFPLVPAYAQCTTANRTHGPPLASGSCHPPAPLSPYITVGTADSNGGATNSIGSERVKVLAGNPQTSVEEADVQFAVSLTDVRSRSGLTDYTGELQVVHTLRITDRVNADNLGRPGLPATMRDYSLKFAVPCSATPSATVGATCSITTTADVLIPGAVLEGKRTLWELDRVRVFDGGSDGVASTDDNVVFATQGVFVP